MDEQSLFTKWPHLIAAGNQIICGCLLRKPVSLHACAGEPANTKRPYPIIWRQPGHSFAKDNLRE